MRDRERERKGELQTACERLIIILRLVWNLVKPSLTGTNIKLSATGDQ